MAVDFNQLIARNRRCSAVLMGVFVVLIAALACVIGQAIAGDWAHALFIGAVAAGLSILMSLASYYGGASAVLAISGARPIDKVDDPQLFNVVEEMAIAAGLPAPKVYVINDSAPNAFATGRDPAHGVLAITTGLRSKLTRDELQGVVAHEMSHIGNYDIRYMMLVAVLVGIVVMLCDLFLRTLRFGGRRTGRSSDRGRGGGQIQIVIVVIAIVLAILAPLLAKLLQMAVSRQREYLADATAVRLTRYPLGLASALAKIAADPDPLEVANRGTQHLYIVNPLNKEANFRGALMATHPPIQERIARLQAMAHEYPDRPQA